MNASSFLTGLCFALFLSLSGQGVLADEGKNESRGKERKEARDKDDRKRKDDREYGRDRRDHRYFHEHGYTNLRIPEGHLPPPGECRVWHPGKPPGHQPPPVKCDRVGVPHGAWLLRRPREDHKHVNVHVYDERSPGVVVSIGIFAANTGAFIRYVSP
jgi:hypothetical protein